MLKSSLSPLKIFAAAAGTVSILLISILLSFQRFNELKVANAWNVHTYRVLLETSNVIRGLVDIQTSARGFLQTGDENYLDTFRSGQSQYDEHYKNALLLTRDSAIQQKRFLLLERQRLIWMNGHILPLIKMRRATRDTPTAMRLAEPGTRTRKIIMDAMQKTIASIEGTELELLQERTNRENQLQAVTQTTLLVNGIFAVVLAAGLSMILARRTGKMDVSHRQLSEQMARRERAEREAQMLHEHNEMILEAAQDGICGVNQAGRTTFFNPAAEAITGYTEAEVLGKPHHDLLHYKRPDGTLYPVSECPIMATLKNNVPHKSDKEVFWHKEGRPIAVEYTSAPLVMSLDNADSKDGDEWNIDGTPVTEDGRQVGAVIVFRDITERRTSEQALQELASIVEYSEDCIIGMGLNGVITRWNRAATKIYGFNQGDMIGQPFSRLVPADSDDKFATALEKVKLLQPVDRYEATHMRKDGIPVEVVVSLSPIMDPSGQIIGAAIISREVFRSRLRREGKTIAAQEPASATNTTVQEG
jgi:PAS domain S-box-containing protein